MASVNFKKCNGAGTAKAMMRHSERDERLSRTHSNPDIDKSLTANNTSLFGLTYAEMCQKYDDRIKLLDLTTNTNKRADRVTMFALEYSVPEGLNEALEDSYLSDVEKLIEAKYGRDNIIESCRHYDEKHEYMDHGVTKMSRAHAHVFVVPEIDGKLNGKKFSSKRNMIELNRAIDDMSREKYHIAFMTGQQARHKTVEELKHDSQIEEQKSLIEQNNKILADQHEQAQELVDQKKQLKIEAEEAEKALSQKKDELKTKEKALSGKILKLNELQEYESHTFWNNEIKQNLIKTAYAYIEAHSNNNALKNQNKALKEQFELKLKEKDEALETFVNLYHKNKAEIKELESQVKELAPLKAFAQRYKEAFAEFMRSISERQKEHEHDERSR